MPRTSRPPLMWHHVSEQLGVAVAVAGDERADLDSRRGLGPGAQHRPAFEVLAVGRPVQREEVVPVEDHVGARVLGLSDGATDLGIVGVLWLQLDGDPDRVGHGSIMAHLEQTGPRTAPLLSGGALRTRCRRWSSHLGYHERWRDIMGVLVNRPVTTVVAT